MKATEERFLRALYAEQGPALRSFIRHQGVDPGQVEDIMQEVMLRAWRSVDRLGGLAADDENGNKIRMWLFTTARNVIIDRWRAGRRRPLLLLDDQEYASLATGGRPTLDNALDGWLIEEAVRRLSEEHRQIVIELYYHRHTVREAAQRLGIPEGTAKSRSYYAVRALRTIFDEMGVTR